MEISVEEDPGFSSQPCSSITLELWENPFLSLFYFVHIWNETGWMRWCLLHDRRIGLLRCPISVEEVMFSHGPWGCDPPGKPPALSIVWPQCLETLGSFVLVILWDALVYKRLLERGHVNWNESCLNRTCRTQESLKAGGCLGALFLFLSVNTKQVLLKVPKFKLTLGRLLVINGKSELSGSSPHCKSPLLLLHW